MPQRSEWRIRHLRPLIANRDGWICWRCKQPIDPMLRWPHRMSVSLEHRTELAAGGDPWHPDNLGVSHLTCNLSAGASFGNARRKATRSARW